MKLLSTIPWESTGPETTEDFKAEIYGIRFSSPKRTFNFREATDQEVIQASLLVTEEAEKFIRRKLPYIKEPMGIAVANYILARCQVFRCVCDKTENTLDVLTTKMLEQFGKELKEVEKEVKLTPEELTENILSKAAEDWIDKIVAEMVHLYRSVKMMSRVKEDSFHNPFSSQNGFRYGKDIAKPNLGFIMRPPGLQ